MTEEIRLGEDAMVDVGFAHSFALCAVPNVNTVEYRACHVRFWLTDPRLLSLY
jgi:hypothetical protein